ncbi:hypothetical protein L1887_54237 [Cichorium endivia]|nr:hypothetical protein L1887_54237 [Cichorium endivia]
MRLKQRQYTRCTRSRGSDCDTQDADKDGLLAFPRSGNVTSQRSTVSAVRNAVLSASFRAFFPSARLLNVLNSLVVASMATGTAGADRVFCQDETLDGVFLRSGRGAITSRT